MAINLEDTTDKSLEELGVTGHITHMKLPEDCYYSHITLATQKAEKYRVLDIAVSMIFLEGSIKHITGSALDTLIVRRFAGLGAGASPCHAIDNFSRKRGRIIAKGRLLKHIRSTTPATIIGYRFGRTEEQWIVSITESDDPVEATKQKQYIESFPEAGQIVDLLRALAREDAMPAKAADIAISDTCDFSAEA